MSYTKVWNKILNSNEEVKYEFSLGNRYRMFWIIVSVIFCLLLLMGGLVKTAIVIFLIALFYLGFYLKVANAYALTNKRVLVHKGWLSTGLISVDYDKITDVKISEPLISRIFTKTGNLAINTAGSIGDEIILRNIGSPYDVKKKLDALR